MRPRGSVGLVDLFADDDDDDGGGGGDDDADKDDDNEPSGVVGGEESMTSFVSASPFVGENFTALLRMLLKTCDRRLLSA